MHLPVTIEIGKYLASFFHFFSSAKHITLVTEEKTVKVGDVGS